jgi:methionyl aminopeptidase
MRITNNAFSSSGLVNLKNQDWLDKQRVAGKVVAGALLLLENEIKQGTNSTLIELNSLAETYIQDHGCSCTFKNYKSFPSGVCISVGKQLVHGVPTNYRLQDGDKVSFDLGATYKKAIADSAITCIFGQPKSKQQLELIKDTEEALMRGIQAIEVGKHLGCIGNAIDKYAKNKGHGCITQYGGHGLDWDIPHAAPFVANRAELNEGIRIQPNLTIAVEPMLTSGSTKTWTDQDGWTVWCEAEIVSHWEHTIYIHEDYVEIITDRSKL